MIYRKDIDGLRAIAVGAVVIFHAFPNLITGGFVGVDVFFVISGYLISSIIMKGLASEGFSFFDFYSRRVNRIFPALLLVLASSWIFGWFSLLSDEYTQLGKHIAGGSVFLSNIVLLMESGYFDNSANTKILLHLWSLGVEEQFYLIWPVILVLAWKFKKKLLTAIITLGMVSFGISLLSLYSDPTIAFYSPQSRFWELLIGAFLSYLTLNNHLERFDSVKNHLSIVGALLLALSFYLISESSKFPGWWAFLPTLGAFLLIASGPDALINRLVLSSKILVWIGLISFPLYLWHWPLLTFSRIIESGEPSVISRVIIVLLSVILSWLTYKFIEVPLRSKGAKKSKTTILTLSMVFTGVIGYITYMNAGFPNRIANMKVAEVNAQFVGPQWKYSNNDICKSKYKFNESKDYDWWFCMANSHDNPSIVLVGNSFANHLYPGFIKNKNLEKNSILSFGACDVGKSDVDNSVINKNSPCYGDRSKHQKDFLNKIVSNSNSVKYAIFNGLSKNPSIEYIKEVDARVSFFESHNVKVIIFIPHINVNYDIKGCFSRPLKNANKTCIISLEQRDNETRSFSKLTDYLLKQHRNILIFDQNNLFCTDKECSMIIDGMPAFRDEYSHLSEFASEKMADIFVEWAKVHAPNILTN